VNAGGGEPSLIALSDRTTYPDCDEHLKALMSAAKPGSVVVVLRDKESPLRERFERGERLLRLARETGQRLVVSDRVDLALALGADGVHLPSDGLRADAVRELPGMEERWISRASHGWDLLPAVELAALDALLVSPVFAERKGRSALGEEGLSVAARAVRVRAPELGIFALGGANASHVAGAHAAGAEGLAVIGAVMSLEERTPLLCALKIARER